MNSYEAGANAMLNDKKKLREKNIEDRRNLKNQEKERKRNQIYAAAIKLFTDKGFENVAVEDITIKAKVAYGTFYTFFSSKEDVLMYFFEHKYSKTREELDLTIGSKAGLIDKVDALFDAYWMHVIKHKEFARVMAPRRIMLFGKSDSGTSREFFALLAQLIEDNFRQKGAGGDNAREATRIAKILVAINIIYTIYWINGTMKSKQECLGKLKEDIHSILTAMCT
jgi:AcrR family transcriptional regulator